MSNTIDQQFIEYIVKSLVSKPDEVKIERRIDEKGVLLELTVDPEDLGRVIGKRGATAQSLRTLLRALGTKQDARYNLKIVDTNEGYSNNRSRDYDRDQNDSYSSKDNGTSDDDYVKSDNDEPEAAPEELPEVVDEDDSKAEEKAEEPEEVVEEVDDEPSDRIKKARKELADLDDLDV